MVGYATHLMVGYATHLMVGVEEGFGDDGADVAVPGPVEDVAADFAGVYQAGQAELGQMG